MILKTRRGRRPTGLIASVVACVFVATLALAGLARAETAACTNEAIRIEQGVTRLNDCRAYELVTPATADPYMTSDSYPYPDGYNREVRWTQAAHAGGSLAWFTFYPLEGSAGDFSYVSRRTEDGWTTEDIGPAESTSQEPELTCRPGTFFSEDLRTAVLVDGQYSDAPEQDGPVEGEGEFCGRNEPSLVPEEPLGFENLFAMNLDPISYGLIDALPPGEHAANAEPQYVSPEANHVIFAEDAKLTPDAPSGRDLYEWGPAGLSLVTVLPEGRRVAARMAGGSYPVNAYPEVKILSVERSAAEIEHATSEAGSRVLFVSGEHLYMRINPEAEDEIREPADATECGQDACTLEVDASQTGGAGGGGQLLAASANGSDVYFVDQDSADLTPNTASGDGDSLYDYEAESGTLVDLTPTSLSDKPTVLGFSGIGGEGSETYLYFVAEGDLVGTQAQAGHPNLYLAHDGSITLIATLAHSQLGESKDWLEPEATSGELVSESSPDGRYFAFLNDATLTAYENVNIETGTAEEEVYLYDVGTGEVSCPSCDPNGAAPLGPAIMQAAEASADVPEVGPLRLRRMVLDDGSVFFDSPDPLASGAVSGIDEVYEYREGKISPISSGTSTEGSFFYEASADGNEVFFITSQKLLRSDTGAGVSIYDARVEGGFPEPALPVACSGEACRVSSPLTTAPAPPASSSYSGPGNLAPPKPGGKQKSPTLTRSQRLAKALAGCRKQRKRRRARCKRQARRKFGTKAKRGAKAKGKQRTKVNSKGGARR